MRTSIFNKPTFWVIFTVTSLAAAIGGYHLFPIAFPLVNLDLTMDRTTALSKAHDIAKKLALGPKTFSQAAAFSSDDTAKNFIELEGGGSEKLTDVMQEEYFAPYFWQVRHFNPGQKHEVDIYFMPDGRPYGFEETIPDSKQLPSLTSKQAEQLGQQNARQHWFIDFSEHTLVEHSQDTKPNGRVDHTFVYERVGQKIANAPFRVTIEVAGNTVSKVEIDLKVPEAFERRYAHMRSANNAIATWAQGLFYLLYILLGCLLGLVMLIRADRSWLLWRAPLFWAVFLSVGQFLDSVNSYPTWWMYYQTTDSTLSFLLSMFYVLLLSTAQTFGILFISFLAAENLGRKAFGKHIQLWSLGSLPVASSWQALGRTLAGYLMVGFKFLYVTLLYVATTRLFGWWYPTYSLVNPNILATYVPWLSPLITSLRAGFWEECLFRAVPLSCAALIAKRYGNKRWWLGGALILQALIFAAVHANYPAQPAYARVIEIFFPYVLMGIIYLVFGLLPAIIAHVMYDLVLFALPVFVADGLGLSKLIIILGGLIPLAYTLYARAQTGKWHELAAQWYNKAWKSTKKPAQARVKPKKLTPLTQPANFGTLLLLAGILGVGAWGWFRRIAQDTKPLAITKEHAVNAAYKAQGYYNLTVPDNLTTLASAGGKVEKEDVFVWRIAGKDVYKKLVGNFLTPPFWQVRYATFEGDLIQRAEEYNIFIGPDGSPLAFKHTLPKEQQGAQLPKDQARQLAFEVLKTYYQLTPEDVTQVSAQEEQQPHRKDWTFTYKVNEGPDIGKGQLRVKIVIGGDKVIAHKQLVHVPEEWERQYTYTERIKWLVKNLSFLLIAALLMLLFMHILRAGYVQSFALWSALMIGASLLIKSLLQIYNVWPTATIHFKTTAPFARQAGSLITGTLVSVAFRTLFLAWLGGYVIGLVRGSCTRRKTASIVQGICLGLVIAGMVAFGTWLSPDTKPFWVPLTDAGARLPWLSVGLKAFTNAINATLIGLFTLHGLNVLSNFGRARYGVTALVCIVLGFAGFGMQGILLSQWILGGLATGVAFAVLYYGALRYATCSMPALIATVISINALQQALLHGFPGAWPGALCTILLSAATAWWFMYEME